MRGGHLTYLDSAGGNSRKMPTAAFAGMRCVTEATRHGGALTAAEERVGGTGDLSAAIEAARAGDDNAFRTVYREIQPGLLRYVRVLVGDDAEDVTSETWLQIARGLDGFTGGADEFRAWSATVARNRALDHLRYVRRRPAVPVPDDLLADIESSPDPADEVVNDVAGRRALQLIATLPTDQAEAVLLRVVMGLDANFAGQVLGKRAGAVRTAAYRGLRRLAAVLDSERAGHVQGDHPEHGPVPRQRDAGHGGTR